MSGHTACGSTREDVSRQTLSLLAWHVTRTVINGFGHAGKLRFIRIPRDDDPSRHSETPGTLARHREENVWAFSKNSGVVLR